MTHKPFATKVAALSLVVVSAALSLACMSGGPVLKPNDAKTDETRVDKCNAILGRAFSSADERQWFIDNCSTWPQRHTAESASAPVPAPTDTPECAAMRGKLYSSPEQRQWFLSNCVRSGFVSQPDAGATADSSPGGDRTNCDEIRGTEYRSQNERQWFLANCVAAIQQNDGASHGNPRRNSSPANRPH